jgi:hypothetical protein
VLLALGSGKRISRSRGQGDGRPDLFPIRLPEIAGSEDYLPHPPSSLPHYLGFIAVGGGIDESGLRPFIFRLLYLKLPLTRNIHEFGMAEVEI